MWPSASRFVTITAIPPGGEGVLDTIPLEGEISINTRVVPPNPIRVSALVSLSGVGESTATCYITQGGSTLHPGDPYIPTDPYHVTFTTQLIALPAEAPCEGDASAPSPPPITPTAAVIYQLTIDATLLFDEAGALTETTIDIISVP